MQLTRIKDRIVREKGVCDHNISETLARSFDDIVSLLTPWVTDYAVLQQKVGELEKRLEKYEPKEIKPVTDNL